MGKNWEGSGRGLIEVLPRDLPGGTKENHKKPVRIAGVPVKIRTKRLPNISLDQWFSNCGPRIGPRWSAKHKRLDQCEIRVP
jgi:hypothetical protein